MHCTLIHGYIKSPNMNFVFWLQSMPYDVKIGSHKIKIVIDLSTQIANPAQFYKLWLDWLSYLAGKS
jgi:hypothetical protein